MMPEDPYAYVVAAFQAPPSPDYVPGLEYLPSPDFVSELVYPEFMPPEDEVLPAEEQLLPAADDDDDESSDDDEDDDDDIEEDEDEEEEHPAPADFVSPPVHRVTTRMSIREAEAPSTSHPPPLGTPPSGTPPLLPIPARTSSPYLLLPSTDHGADMPEVCLPPQRRLCIALGPRYEVEENSSAPAARPTGGFKADYGFVATLDKEIRHNPEREVGYGITDAWDKMLEDMPGAPATDETELGRRMTDFVTTVKQDIYEIYVRLDDAQDESLSTAVRDCSFAGRRPHQTGSACEDTKTDEYTTDIGDNIAEITWTH
ncbi:hypothetical protein Tco_0453649 [Tanacetum coccineum]